MITIKQRGNFSKTIRFLNVIYKRDFKNIIEQYAKEGVEALSFATPVDTGATASSWGYDIDYGLNKITISWTNSNQNQGIPIAILIQYGHSTESGYYVQGTDFINPAIRPIFDKIADKVWKEVTSA